MDPQINSIVDIKKGRYIIEVPKYAARKVRTVNAGKPNKSCDNAKPVM
jgi:hypothetical protein